MKPGEAHEHFLYVTLESKTGGVFVVKLKPLHGVVQMPKKEALGDVMVKKQEKSLYKCPLCHTCCTFAIKAYGNLLPDVM